MYLYMRGIIPLKRNVMIILLIGKTYNLQNIHLCPDFNFSLGSVCRAFQITKAVLFIFLGVNYDHCLIHTIDI